MNDTLKTLREAYEAWAREEANARTIAALKAHGGNDAE